MQLTIITFFSLLISLSMIVPASMLRGLTGASKVDSFQQVAASTTPSQAPADRGWPRGYSLPSEAQMVVYQPQIASWQDQKHAIGLAAVAYVSKGEQKPAMGTIKLETETQVSVERRLVQFSTVKITETNFPTLSKTQTQEIVTQLEQNIPDEDRLIALDRVLAYVDKSSINPKNVDGLKSDPPTIFLTNSSSVLLSFDGDPIWSPIKDNELKFAVNTNWDVFRHEPTGLFYLRNEATWLRSTSINGPWSVTTNLPDSFTKLPDDENWKDVRASLPAKPAAQVPYIYVTTAPAELIEIQGAPKYVPVPNTGLLWISNTESDLFRMGKDGPVYYLVAGRWFRAPNLNGNWTFATPDLPEDFKRISVEHPRSRVLASVPGTQQAAEAVLLAQVPQYARVDRNEIKAPDVVYQGEPQFDLIPGTALLRASNTDKEVIKAGHTYYLCFQGVWFMSENPKGPWALATDIPPEIYNIPPSSPAHSVTYVKVENADSQYVTYASYAGYTGLMIGWGCAVWGTGWYYPPYYWYGGYYPIYYPYFRTFGYGAWYNPYTGIYGTAGRIYGPYGGVGFGARYNPSTGTYARGAFAYGPYGARGAAQAYNPRTGTYAQTRQGSGVYGSWGSTQVQRGDNWASTKRFTNSAGNTTRVTRGSQGGAVISRRGPDGGGFVGSRGDNVYAGRDGNVYKRDASGSWQKWNNGSWTSPNRPTQNNGARDSMLNDRAKQTDRQTRENAARGERTGQSGARSSQMDRSTKQSLDRDRAARMNGTQRTRNYGTYNRSGGAGTYRGGGGFRGGGGGFRGGGGRR